MKKKVIHFWVFVFGLLVLCSCGKSNYNAVMYSHAEEWISESFLKENRVKAYYLNEGYIEEENEPSSKYIYDETAPKFRCFILTEEKEFRNIVSSYEEDIDFEKEMGLLYVFADVNPYREYFITRINLDNQDLTIYFKLQNSGKKDTTAPYQRCLLVKMDKLEITSVSFFEQN